MFDPTAHKPIRPNRDDCMSKYPDPYWKHDFVIQKKKTLYDSCTRTVSVKQEL